MIPKKKMINESYKCIWISNHLPIRHLKENPYNDSYMLQLLFKNLRLGTRKHIEQLVVANYDVTFKLKPT